jgi:hypothetical protein
MANGDPRMDAPEKGPVGSTLEIVKRPQVWGLYSRNFPPEIPSSDFAKLEQLFSSGSIHELRLAMRVA